MTMLSSICTVDVLQHQSLDHVQSNSTSSYTGEHRTLIHLIGMRECSERSRNTLGFCNAIESLQLLHANSSLVGAGLEGTKLLSMELERIRSTCEGKCSRNCPGCLTDMEGSDSKGSQKVLRKEPHTPNKEIWCSNTTNLSYLSNIFVYIFIID